MAAMRVDAEGSRLEPGCLRFDCLRDSENENKFCEPRHFSNSAALLPSTFAFSALKMNALCGRPVRGVRVGRGSRSSQADGPLRGVDCIQRLRGGIERQQNHCQPCGSGLVLPSLTKLHSSCFDWRPDLTAALVGRALSIRISTMAARVRMHTPRNRWPFHLHISSYPLWNRK